MAFKDSLTSVRYYTAADPYYYSIDNRPLEDLDDRDDALADELDRRTHVVDITGHATTPVTNTIPSGWTMARTATGVYTITHTLGNTNFIVVGNIVGATKGILNLTSTSSTQFVITTSNVAGVDTDLRFNVLVTGY